jgi:hypothetical protein
VQLSRPKWFAVLVCLLIVLFVLFCTRTQGDLLSRASRLAAVQGVITNELTYAGYSFFYHHVPSYFWLSDTELFSIHEVRRGVYESVRIDLTTGKVGREPGRSPIDAGQGAGDKAFCWTVSPDGKWILSISKARNDEHNYTAKRFDATRQVAWTNHYDGSVQPTWLGDSSGFIEWPVRDGVGYARVHWLDTGGTNELNLDALPAERLDRKKSFEQPNAMIISKMWREGSAAEFIELKRDENGLAAKRYCLAPPAELARGEGRAFLSPRGDRLAWVVSFTRRFPRISFQRRDPYLAVEPVNSTVVCLSQLDGSEVRVLGHLKSGLDINRVTWTPNASKLSFVCDNAFWTVAAD